MKIKFVKEWVPELKGIMGLPRPYAKYGSKGFPNPLRIPSKTPIPWQSFPILETGRIGLEKELEPKVWSENRCGYCGVVFGVEDVAIRWLTMDKIIGMDGLRVFSDYHPFHLECMVQTRIFCPFMKKTKDEEFETGIFKELKEKAIKEIESKYNLK